MRLFLLIVGLLSNLTAAGSVSTLLLGSEGQDFYVRGDRDRKTGVFTAVPLFDVEGSKVGELPSGKAVRAFLMDQKGQLYQGQEGFVPHPKKRLWITFEGDSKWAFSKKTGVVRASDLHPKPLKEPLSQYTPNTQLFLNKGASYLQLPDCSSQDCQKDFDVKRAIYEFHNSFCNGVPAESSKRFEDLVEQWKLYGERRGPWAKGIIERAMEQDFVARTVLYESHPGEQLNSLSAGLSDCERDLITLSIVNRGRLCRSYMGCKRFPGKPFMGVATAASQYHIWRDENVRNTYISSCFLRDDLAAETYLEMEPKKQASYLRRRNSFARIVESLETLIPEQKMSRKQWRQYANSLFDLKKVDNKKVKSKKQKAKYLLNYAHYYHRGGLLTCRVENYADTRYVKAQYVKARTPQGKIIWGLLISDRVDFGEASLSKDQPHWKEVYFPKKLDRSRLIFPSSWQVTGGSRVFMDRRQAYKETNSTYTCLPQGKLPQCLEEKDLVSPIYGRRVPTSWFNPAIKKEVNKMFKGLGISLGAQWDRMRVTRGKAMAVQCLRGPHRPKFEGLCDSKFMPVTGTD